MSPKAKYRNAYITEPGYNFRPLDELVQGKVFLTTGAESTLGEIYTAMERNLIGFDPALDIIVPAGRTMLAFLIATLMFDYEDLPGVKIAVYRNRSYQIFHMNNISSMSNISFRDPVSEERQNG